MPSTRSAGRCMLASTSRCQPPAAAVGRISSRRSTPGLAYEEFVLTFGRHPADRPVDLVGVPPGLPRPVVRKSWEGSNEGHDTDAVAW